MKITFMLTWADSMGGTERAVFTQAEHLADRHEVEILSVFQTAKEPFFDIDPRVTVRYLVDGTGPVPRPVRESALDDAACGALAEAPSRLIHRRWEGAFSRLSDMEIHRALRTLDTDVLVSTTPALLAVTTTLPPARVVTVHQEHRASHFRGATGEPLFRFAPRTDAIVVLTQSNAGWLAETLRDCGPRVEVIPNSFPAGFRPRSSLTAKTVTMAQRLVPEKQVAHAIRAFAQVAKVHPEWVLRVFGDGPQQTTLRRLVFAHDLHDNVQFLGPAERMAEEWSKSSIALLTSTSESFPLALLESFAAGLPIVSYESRPGPAEIIDHGENGFLVAQNDIDGLARSVIRLIEDDDLRRRTGAAAFRSVAQYGTDLVTRRWEDFYRSLLADGDGTAREVARTERASLWALRTGGLGFAPAVAPPEPPLKGGERLRQDRLRAAEPDLVEFGGRLARVADDLMPADATRRNLELVTSVLAAADVPYQVVRDPGVCYRVAVRAVHRETAVRALIDAHDGRPVYGAPLRPAGLVSRSALLGDIADQAGELAGLRVFEPVVTPSRSLAYGSDYGCDLEFWSDTEDGGGLVATRRTIVGDTIPLEAMEPGRIEIAGRVHPSLKVLERPLVDDVDFPIDVVYRWADETGPVRGELRAGAAGRAGAAPETPARSRGSLRHSLRSLEMYAPWINHIWLVTDRQVPDWLDTSRPGITVVDQNPFNPHAIEMRLHHIEGLADRFLYFGDDLYLGRPLDAQTFFDSNGDSRYFTFGDSISLTPGSRDDDLDVAAAKNNRRLIEDAFGRSLTDAFGRVPHPLRRDVLAELEERFPEEYARTAASPVPSPTDVAVPSLHHHYAFLTGRGHPGKIRYQDIDVADPYQHPQLTSLLARRTHDVVRVNGTAGEVAPIVQETVVDAFLDAYFPVASEFEKGSPRNVRRGRSGG